MQIPLICWSKYVGLAQTALEHVELKFFTTLDISLNFPPCSKVCYVVKRGDFKERGCSRMDKLEKGTVVTLALGNPLTVSYK